MKVCLFVYEFPHFKSEHGLKTLLSYGHDISLVIAQPFKKLSVPRSNFKISPKLPVSGDLKAICELNRNINVDGETAYSAGNSAILTANV